MNPRPFSLRSKSLSFAILSVVVLAFALPASAGNQVPFKTDTALVSIPAPTNTGCPNNTVRMNVTGPGTASHMGIITVTEFVCINPSDLTFVAHFTITAANGDQVFGMATGDLVPASATSFTVHGNWVINGGTGRFVGATGSGTALGSVDLVTGASPHHLSGTISSVGSTTGH
jgi:hypothetical protein